MRTKMRFEGEITGKKHTRGTTWGNLRLFATPATVSYMQVSLTVSPIIEPRFQE